MIIFNIKSNQSITITVIDKFDIEEINAIELYLEALIDKDFLGKILLKTELDIEQDINEKLENILFLNHFEMFHTKSKLGKNAFDNGLSRITS